MTRTDSPIDPNDESDEMLMALADGELDDATADGLWRRIESDPALADRFSLFADTRHGLQAAYPPQPVSDQLIATIMAGAPAPVVVPFGRKLAARPVAGWAMAASVVLAVGLGGFLAGRMTPPAGGMLQQAAVALAQVPTGGDAVLADGAVARALASYDTDLGVCRLIEAQKERALMCRDQDGWSVALAVAGAGQDAFLPASDLGTALIDAALDEIGAGPALDLGAEAAALTD
ncbi:anti-sigma factor family protein [Paracoccus sp. Ld10]|uniref:anti-sigma factor family protein n=1 Tax=Paracoccus sp. Ld10 TaxID=649158 RepID=UPI00386F1B80